MNIELLFKWQFICTLSCASCGDWVATHVFQFLTLNSHHELKQFFHIPILQRVHSSTNTKWYFFIMSKHTSFSTTFSLVFMKTENRCVFFFSELQAFSRCLPWLWFTVRLPELLWFPTKNIFRKTIRHVQHFRTTEQPSTLNPQPCHDRPSFRSNAGVSHR